MYNTSDKYQHVASAAQKHEAFGKEVNVAPKNFLTLFYLELQSIESLCNLELSRTGRQTGTYLSKLEIKCLPVFSIGFRNKTKRGLRLIYFALVDHIIWLILLPKYDQYHYPRINFGVALVGTRSGKIWPWSGNPLRTRLDMKRLIRSGPLFFFKDQILQAKYFTKMIN